MPNTIPHNKVRGAFVLNYGGVSILLEPTHSNLASLEGALDRSLIALAASAMPGQRGITYQDWATIIHTLMSKPKLSREAITDMIIDNGVVSLTPIIEWLMQVVTQGVGSFPNPQAESEAM